MARSKIEKMVDDLKKVDIVLQAQNGGAYGTSLEGEAAKMISELAQVISKSASVLDTLASLNHFPVQLAVLEELRDNLQAALK